MMNFFVILLLATLAVEYFLAKRLSKWNVSIEIVTRGAYIFAAICFAITLMGILLDSILLVYFAALTTGVNYTIAELIHTFFGDAEVEREV